MKIKKESRLSGIPRIIYMNSDDETRFKFSVEQTFRQYNIDKFTRKIKDPSENWKKHVIDDLNEFDQSEGQLYRTYLYLKSIVEWYDQHEDEECAIFMNDTVDLRLCDDWGFNWKFLFNALPYNWDCILLHVIRDKVVYMHVKPLDYDYEDVDSMCFMITRQFAKKVKQKHYIDGKYKFHIDNNDRGIYESVRGKLNYFLFRLGITYEFPVFHTISKHETERENGSSFVISYWWRKLAKNYTTYDIFHYNAKGNIKLPLALEYEKLTSSNEKFILWI